MAKGMKIRMSMKKLVRLKFVKSGWHTSKAKFLES